MPIPNRQPAQMIAGIQRWKSRSLIDAMKMIGFDPHVEGDEWVLIGTDLHCWYENGSAQADDFDSRIHAECAKLSAIPPDRCFVLGDVLTGLVGSFGSPADTSDGLLEVAAANKGMLAFTDLAPTSYVLGNHDTPPLENPLGDFIASNLDAYTGLNHAHTVGGVRFVLLSTSHDGALVDGQDTFLSNELSSLGDLQECVIATHQPSGGRAYDYHCGQRMAEVVPAGMTNSLWHIAGHNHSFTDSVRIVENTTIAKWTIGSGGGAWLSFSDGTHPALAAMACRRGKVIGRFAWDGKLQQWHLLEEFDRSNPSSFKSQFDGINHLNVEATYREGFYDRTGHFNASSGSTYRIPGTWLSYCYHIESNFPIPNGATKFWFIATAVPGSIEMSSDGSTWQTVSAASFADSAVIIDIPAGLQAASDLHTKLTSFGGHISAWGFAS